MSPLIRHKSSFSALKSLLYAFGHNVSCQFCRRYGVYHINILQIRCSQLSRPRQINTTQYHSCSSMVKKCYVST
jgi:hypothetical protein